MNHSRGALGRFRSRVVAFGLMLAALTLILLLPSDGAAIPCGYRYTYYSDASYTTVVGVSGTYSSFCGCGLYQMGATSSYRIGGYYAWCRIDF